MFLEAIAHAAAGTIGVLIGHPMWCRIFGNAKPTFKTLLKIGLGTFFGIAILKFLTLWLTDPSTWEP